jgi:hypothetical protein
VGQSDREPGQYRAGEWVLVEAQGRLLSIGKSLFNGQSPRTQLNSLGRRFLLPLLTQTASTGEPATKSFTEAGIEYQAQSEPVLGPSGVVHAVLACYVREGRRPDRRPEIGAWEWDAPKLRTHWTPDLFRVYGYPAPPAGQSFWEAPEWFGLTESGGFPALMEVLARFQTGRLADLQIHLFRISRADTGAIQRLRLAGRTYFDQDGTVAWFRGVTVRVDGHYLGIDEQFNQQQYLDAALMLNPAPVCVANLSGDLRVMLNNTPWERVGLDMPQDGLFISAVHPEDRTRVRAFLQGAAIAPSPGTSVTQARCAAGSGWIKTELAAVRLSIDEGEMAVSQVMIRLRPQDRPGDQEVDQSR